MTLLRVNLVPLTLCGVLLILATSGCAGRGEVVVLDLHSTPGAVHTSISQTAPLKIAVVPLQEEYPVHLWSRTHLWGGNTYYTVPGGRPVRVLGRVLAEYFNQRGWHAWDTASEKDTSAAGADVTITGTVQDFSVSASSYFGRTWLQTNIKMAIVATNAKDGSTVRMALEHDASKRVFWFEPEDVQAIVRDGLTWTLTKFVLSTRVDGRSLRER